VSGYGTLIDRPEIDRPPLGENGKQDLSLLDAGKVRLRPELGKPGRANKAQLSTLIAKGEREQREQGWSAADYNNLACAYFWFNREEGKLRAIHYLNQALSHSPNDEEKKIIDQNLNLLKAPSKAG
jgi:hypothetical protein